MLLAALSACSDAPDASDGKPRRDRDPRDVLDTGSTDTDETTGTTPTTPPDVTCVAGATMSWSPRSPDSDDTVRVSITGDVGYVWVALAATAPDGSVVAGTGETITGSGPYTWSYDLRTDAAGTWSVRFTADSGATDVCAGTMEVAAGDGGGTTVDPPQGLYGIHTWSAGASAILSGKRGWSTETITAWESVDVARYEAMRDEGFTPILRINNGYCCEGTIPLDGDYTAFCEAAAAQALALDGVVDHFVIGNEMNSIWEGDGSRGFTPSEYAACYRECVRKIHAVRPDAQVLVGAVACWNDQTSASGPYGYDFDNYWHELIEKTYDVADGVAVHTYGGRGGDADPADDGYWGFQYLDTQLDIIDAAGGGALPIYVTEFNHAAGGWTSSGGENWPTDAYADGWIQKAFAYVDAVNAARGCRIEAATWFTYDLAGWAGFNLTTLTTAREDFAEATATTNFRACD
ncbi:MAG: hypothetical protein ACOZNI_34070 [Myxococcota bacterium]